MLERRSQRASLLVLLKLVTLQSVIVYSLSISPSTKNSLTNGSVRNNQHSPNQIPISQPQQQPQQSAQQVTTLPPLITTISQNNYLDSIAQHQAKHHNHQHQHHQQDVERRSNSEEQEDQIAQAAVNNHSKNNQQIARPPQYVDVSALVGRNLSSSSSSSSFASGTALAQNGASGLSAKSRSGLPECATQQVCNAIFVRMNYTQKLCECSSNYNWKCSHTLDPQDGHTIELTRKFDKRIYTQIKTCEPLREVRACKSPTDWTLLALQSERSGKAHYVVVCKCPTWAQLEGPYTHNHPPYANIPGIRVYGMLCAHQTARSSAQTYATYNPALSIYPEFPWSEALNVLNTTNLLSTIDSH